MIDAPMGRVYVKLKVPKSVYETSSSLRLVLQNREKLRGVKVC